MILNIFFKVEPLQHHRPFSMQQQSNINNTSPTSTDADATFSASPSLDFSAGYAHNSLRFNTNAKYDENGETTTNETQQRQQFGIKNAIHSAMTNSSYAQLSSVGRNNNSNDHSSNPTTTSGMAVHPFATLQRASGPTVCHPKPPTLGTFALRNSSNNDSSSFLKSRTTTRAVAAQEKSVNNKTTETLEDDEEAQISRAHSLRDLASKFERISATNINNGNVAALRNSIKFDDQKRLFEPLTTTKVVHHAAPTTENGGMPTVSKEYLVELHRKLAGKFF